MIAANGSVRSRVRPVGLSGLGWECRCRRL